VITRPSLCCWFGYRYHTSLSHTHIYIAALFYRYLINSVLHFSSPLYVRPSLLARSARTHEHAHVHHCSRPCSTVPATTVSATTTTNTGNRLRLRRGFVFLIVRRKRAVNIMVERSVLKTPCVAAPFQSAHFSSSHRDAHFTSTTLPTPLGVCLPPTGILRLTVASETVGPPPPSPRFVPNIV
jgi:hypothetical protein